MANTAVDLRNQESRTLPGVVVAGLLDRLASDDVFRTLFQQNPAAALRQVGATDAEAQRCVMCLRVNKLADKATIHASRQALIAQLTGTLTQTPVTLSAR